MNKTIFGFLPDGRCVHEYVLHNELLTVHILDMGGIVRRIFVGDKDVACGYDTLEEYLEDTSYQGALIGRVGNRIADGKFTMNGKTYQLAKNDNGINHLHGGTVGFNRKVWNVDRADETSLALSCLSPDGEEGYPGNLSVSVTYRLKEDVLAIEYDAICDADTPINLTNHTYFNLNGYDSGDVLTHLVQISGGMVTELDGDLIPTGKHLDVSGTPYDFRAPHTIGERLSASCPGYDINYLLSELPEQAVAGYSLPNVASVHTAERTLEVFTDCPCLQFYTGNFLAGKPDFKGGVQRQARHAFCMETQYEPNLINMGGGILRAGEHFKHTTLYRLRNY